MRIKRTALLVMALLLLAPLGVVEAQDTVTVRYWHTMSDPETAQLEVQIAAFEEANPGIEIEATRYAYSDFIYDDFTELVSGVPVDRSGNQMPYVPRNQYSLFADYRHPSGFKIRIQTNSWGSYYMDNANTEKYKGYDWVTGLAMGYEVGPHNMSLNVDNLFDQRYAMEAKKDTRGKKYYSAASPLAAMLTYSYNF